MKTLIIQTKSGHFQVQCASFSVAHNDVTTADEGQVTNGFFHDVEYVAFEDSVTEGKNKKHAPKEDAK